MSAVPWPVMYTVTGLELPQNIELDPDICLVKLTAADKGELGAHLGFRFLPWRNTFTGALCFRKPPDPTEYHREAEKLVTAMRLFKPGFLELGLSFQFSLQSTGYSEPNRAFPPWRDRTYIVQQEEIPELQKWVRYYTPLSIHDESLIARVLARFARTYTGDLHERITDAIIGLEALVAPSQDGDISYRVSQRASFLNSDDPEARLAIAKRVRDGYEIRSNIVHTNRRIKADEQLAIECQEYLRCSIKRILQAARQLRDEFCNYTKTHEAKNRFYNAFISFGDFQKALEYWGESERAAATKQQPSRKQHRVNPPAN